MFVLILEMCFRIVVIVFASHLFDYVSSFNGFYVFRIVFYEFRMDVCVDICLDFQWTFIVFYDFELKHTLISHCVFDECLFLH